MNSAYIPRRELPGMHDVIGVTMETETQIKTQRLDDDLVLDSIKILNRLAPLVRKSPGIEERMQMLRRLTENLERVKDSGKNSLEFVGFLNLNKTGKALSIEPKKLSDELSSISYGTIGGISYTVDIISYNNNYRSELNWPIFNRENENIAKAFVEGLVKHIELLMADSQA